MYIHAHEGMVKRGCCGYGDVCVCVCVCVGALIVACKYDVVYKCSCMCIFHGLNRSITHAYTLYIHVYTVHIIILYM